MSSTDIYAAQPAHPYLAQSLLAQQYSDDSRVSDTSPNKTHDTPTDAWRLPLGSGREGFDVFPAGAVIGFSKLKPRGTGDDDNDEVGELCRSMLAAHLRRHHSPHSPQPAKVFIVHPANYGAFTPEALLESLLVPATHQPALSREEAIARLDCVQLFPVYDFTGAVQAIGSVSADIQSLHESSEERSQPAAKSTDDANYRPQPVIFLIAGLDALADGVVRASSPLKGAALLSSSLRALTQTSRRQRHASHPLRVVLVNTNGLGSIPNSAVQPDPSAATDHDHAEGIHSSFRVTGAGGPAVLLSNLLMRVLDQGLDTHVLLSHVRQAWVVEVIKDRIGESVGRWSIWHRNG